MVSPSSLIRTPRQLLVLFLTLTLLPASALVWLGWRLLEQDRILETRRIQERRERATDLLVTALQQAISADEQRLADPSAWRSLPADDARIVVFGPQSIETVPQIRLLYYPFRPALPEAPAELFRSGEDDEFRLQNYAGAIAKFREMARSADAAVRAGALLRLARNLRKAGQLSAALDVYQELSRQGAVAVGGVPAELVARRARCALLAELNRPADLRREAEQLDADLRSARWQLDRAAYLHYADEGAGWLDTNRGPESPESGEEALARAVESLWARWEISQREPGSSSGREIFRSESGSGILIWHSSGDRLAALVAGPLYLERKWMAALDPLLKSQSVRVALQDAEGRPIFGAPLAASGFQALRTASDTRLPWTLVVATADPTADLAQSAARRRLLLAGLALLLAVVSAGSYFVARAVTRELAVARLQSDFVAAVSHEFRTPLTSLRQVTEILSDGRVGDPARLQSYYQTQARATGRLQRLVESLLDFGRMEAGAKPYRMQRLEAPQLVRSVVEEFQTEAAAAGYQIELRMDGDIPAIDADPDALAHALRNLLDNAVKYSPECRTVWVELRRQGGHVAIRIHDQGLGIPRGEQKAIFRKFVRGAASKANGIKGTGIGLAIVEHIVRAHGGEIRLESQPGKGSTFSVLLPESSVG